MTFIAPSQRQNASVPRAACCALFDDSSRHRASAERSSTPPTRARSFSDVVLSSAVAPTVARLFGLACALPAPALLRRCRDLLGPSDALIGLRQRCINVPGVARLTERLKLTGRYFRLNDALKAPARVPAVARWRGPQLNRRFVRRREQRIPFLRITDSRFGTAIHRKLSVLHQSRRLDLPERIRFAGALRAGDVRGT